MIIKTRSCVVHDFCALLWPLSLLEVDTGPQTNVLVQHSYNGYKDQTSCRGRRGRVSVSTTVPLGRPCASLLTSLLTYVCKVLEKKCFLAGLGGQALRSKRVQPPLLEKGKETRRMRRAAAAGAGAGRTEGHQREDLRLRPDGCLARVCGGRAWEVVAYSLFRSPCYRAC